MLYGGKKKYNGAIAGTIRGWCRLLFLVFSYRFDGNELEAWRLLPENKVNPADMLPILLFTFIMQACFCVHEIHVSPRPERGVWLDTLQILPNATTLLEIFSSAGV